MKVIMYMAITPNGIIAKKNDDTSFTTDTEWRSFKTMVNKTGNVIFGRRAYEIMKKQNQFAGIANVPIVIVANSNVKLAGKNYTRAKSPKDAIRILKAAKHSNILVAGGGKLNGSFMKEGLIDDIYLDVEPTILGNGIKLFGDRELEKKLRLIGMKRLSRNEIQLHYKVIK